MLLAGDIGGTKTALGLFSPEGGPRKPLRTATYPSQEHESLEAIVEQFLRTVAGPLDGAAFGVAGPVVGGVAKITNLPWTIDERRLRERFHVSRVRVVNDLVAVASAVPALEASDLHTLSAAPADPEGAIAVIAPGTGLGEAFLVWDGGHYRAYPSEGGHGDFAPRTPVELDLLAALGRDGSHVSYERVCSGRGIPHLYAHLRAARPDAEPAWLRDQLAHAEDPAPVITRAATEPPLADLAVATLRLFVSILGAEAGNLALKVLATGGVYLGGGIPPRIIPALADGAFLQAFANKGRLSGLLRAMPVHVIMRGDAALVGAARIGLEP